MQLLDPTARHISGNESDLADLVGIAEYVVTAVAEDTISGRDAELAVEDWGAGPSELLRAAQQTSNEAAARLLQTCATEHPIRHSAAS